MRRLFVKCFLCKNCAERRQYNLFNRNSLPRPTESLYHSEQNLMQMGRTSLTRNFVYAVWRLG